jgi:hypothetical protein
MIRAGKTYAVTHSVKGPFKCKVVYVGARAVYATLVECSDWMEESVGEDVRINKAKAKFREVKQ